VRQQILLGRKSLLSISIFGILVFSAERCQDVRQQILLGRKSLLSISIFWGFGFQRQLSISNLPESYNIFHK
jgi:hypothetical protein